ncbi:MAG: hypothetical protein A2V67_03265 [Deltaproteobacteria bacterium RBG_13_61_14]|nr:MAG: hypothetical protein A2V67_03265 [Deltaproteobacteria bacterium RBG_13_61_14]
MSEWEKFLPKPTEDTEPYWDYCRKQELRMQKCKGCGLVRFPPSVICPRCWSLGHEWVKLSGRGKVWSWVIFHQAFYPGYADDVPYNTAIIELEEGPRLHANVIGCRNEEIYIEMPVEVAFEKVDDEVTLPKFRPVLS